MQKTEAGQARLKRQADRENDYFSRVLEKHDQEEQSKKRPKVDLEASPAGGDHNAEPSEHIDADGDQAMAANMVERLFQDDMQWALNNVEDMCEKENPELQRYLADYSYFDENSWEELGPKQVQK